VGGRRPHQRGGESPGRRSFCSDNRIAYGEYRREHYGNTWCIFGTWLERLVQDINFDDYESRNYFDLQLRKCGLFQRLEEMGIEDGDVVNIYDFEFEYQR
jgi:GTP-binding protein